MTAEQKKSEEMGVTEDDVNEIKQDISSFRFELIDILRTNGMNCGKASNKDPNTGEESTLVFAVNKSVAEFSYFCFQVERREDFVNVV